MKFTTLMATAAVSIVALGSFNTYADGKADSVDYFAKDKHNYNTYSYPNSGNTTQNTYTDKAITKVSTSMGEVFATGQGMTLYTFTKDAAYESTCYDGCADSWPPYMAKADSKTWGALTVIERKDGTYQWAYKSQPLYTWVGDRQQGETTGHGVGNVWYVAKP